ncbi:MAG: hypothetical protein P8X63_12305, partial [Desulfuromonadaceae bacterium]
MKVFIVTLLTFAISSLCSAADLRFPELAPDRPVLPGYTWELTHPVEDFYLYFARPPQESSTKVGIYFGLHPNFVEPKNANKINGQIFGQSTQWFQTKDYKREALFKYQHTPKDIELILHIWVIAESQKELEILTSAVESLR